MNNGGVIEIRLDNPGEAGGGFGPGASGTALSVLVGVGEGGNTGNVTTNVDLGGSGGDVTLGLNENNGGFGPKVPGKELRLVVGGKFLSTPGINVGIGAGAKLTTLAGKVHKAAYHKVEGVTKIEKKTIVTGKGSTTLNIGFPVENLVEGINRVILTVTKVSGAKVTAQVDNTFLDEANLT